MTETNILTEASKVLHGNRAEAYGSDVTPNFLRVAQTANALLGTKLTPPDAAILMIIVKLSRLQATPQHQDSIVDIAGYAGVLDMLNVESGAYGMQLTDDEIDTKFGRYL